MRETLIILDAGFLSKLSKHFGNGIYLEYDIIEFSKNLAKKQHLFCKHIFYYTAPPFQSESPTKQESERYRKYRTFVKKLSKDPIITIQEGRCQRLRISNKFVYKQKGVDTLATIDLVSMPLEYPEINEIILIASDSDFVPVIKRLKKRGIKITLYTYYQEKDRSSLFSSSNELIKSVHKYVLLSKKDFDEVPLNKKTKK